MTYYSIFHKIAWALLLLGGASGVALFFRAAFGEKNLSSERTATLWGLFIIGVLSGIIIFIVLYFKLL